MAAREIDDREPAKTESQRSRYVIALIIGPAVRDAPGHPLDFLAHDRSLAVEVVLAANSAHKVSLVLEIRVRTPARFDKAGNKDCETIAIAPSDAWECYPSRAAAGDCGRNRRTFSILRGG